MHCGMSEPVHWQDFLLATGRFMRRLPQIADDARERDIYELRPERLDALEIYGAHALMSLESELLRKNKEPPESQHTMDYLVSRLPSFDAADPRDIIFAVYNLARPTLNPPFPVPNYSKSVMDVFCEFVEYCVNITHSLDIICRPWAPSHTHLLVRLNSLDQRRVDTALPSWIPQLDKSTFGTPESIFRGRKHGDSLVGRTRSIYEASKGFNNPVSLFGRLEEPREIHELHPPPRGPHGSHANEDITFRDGLRRGSQANSQKQVREVKLTETFDGTLRVKGLLLGVVQVVSMRMIPEVVPKEVINMAGWQFSQSDESHRLEDVPDELWKSLVANKDWDGNDIAIGARQSCLEALKREDTSGDIRIGDLIKSSKSSDDLKSYLKRIRNICWNRQAFLAGSKKKIFGLAPEKTREGDLVCIIYGCSVPVILRKVSKKPVLGMSLRAPLQTKKNEQTLPSTAGDTKIGPTPPTHLGYYQVVGECYVDSHMDGQAIDNESYIKSEQFFTLV